MSTMCTPLGSSPHPSTAWVNMLITLFAETRLCQHHTCDLSLVVTHVLACGSVSAPPVNILSDLPRQLCRFASWGRSRATKCDVQNIPQCTAAVLDHRAHMSSAPAESHRLYEGKGGFNITSSSREKIKNNGRDDKEVARDMGNGKASQTHIRDSGDWRRMPVCR